MIIRSRDLAPVFSVVKILLLTSVILCSCTSNNNKPIPQKPELTNKNSQSEDNSSGAAKTHEGEASVYSDKLEGKKTASGKPFSQKELTAASKEHPLGSKLKVTAKETGKSTTVTVTDRGPYTKGRIIDLSKTAAKEIGMPHDGVADVKVEKIQ